LAFGADQMLQHRVMDRLHSMNVFVRVAQRAGFAAAARDLRMSPAAVTKHVAALEARVGARLLDRTTRTVSLTEAGRVYLERCLECLQSFDDADASVNALAERPRGLLRVSAPFDLAGPLATVIAAFMTEQAEVTVDLRLSNRVVDLVDEGIDVAVRVSASLDGSYVARLLAPLHLNMMGTPAYFDRHGWPRRPQDLAGHRAILFSEPRANRELVLCRGGKQVKVELDPVMTTNSGEVIRAALLAGAGIALSPSFLVGDELQTGRLVPVLRDWRLRADPKLYAVYPHRRFLAPKVKAFVDALRAGFGDGARDPWWPAELDAEAAPARRSRPAAGS
jgi:DNA-binding transcriptional LysR family regulator